MSHITPELASGAIKAFLASQYEKKTETEQKQLVKAVESNDHEKVTELKETLAEAKDKYSVANWIPDAATRMAKQLKFGTHISKGVHPMSRGDNISFDKTDDLSVTLIGTHSIESNYIDANSSAAALPLAAFFDFEIDDTTKIRDLILVDNTDFVASLAGDQSLAKTYQQNFKAALQNVITEPVTDERNKQLLWVTNAYQGEDIDELNYINIIPLYPSVLTHEMYQRINQLKFSDENKAARDNRFKKTADQQPYISLNNLATVQLGGTKSQNVGRLNNFQSGRNYLLPSLPPILNLADSTFKPSKFANTIFAKSLANKVNPILQDIFYVVKSAKNTVDIRDARKEAMDEILKRIFEFANYMRNDLPAGWTKDSELDECEQFWLDPKRAELPDEEEWSARREQTEWHKEIIHRFARWMNTLLQEKFKDIRTEIADPEHNQWEQDIDAMKRLYERAGKGVFL
ncbi:type I-F CRISPR-associated protein Csy1 [Psychrobacter sp. SHUES1]|uniref:type I-F CRISPR-associated protein Csy1 n=1 Tax=Psychrobacter sp. SHUES1 TaxID=1849383 RepID=UPI0007F336D3|nr:type I-F CRISPR-associated protein Csy1 [Psychrobacter sp. SHUES1]OAP69681.1 type I-F CRISPR-associated protein Csy1 [Psychrobacter sp. SHUES1]